LVRQALNLTPERVEADDPQGEPNTARFEDGHGLEQGRLILDPVEAGHMQ